ncbi:hypothetical protein IAQ61_003037 [Plenodomus lingam]|uniref:uncharacterized protein n=1 Tax=Leptosphaeria maculans TaxID=5022 RepID=UPI003331CAC0|nr:hypothetical protein IAQ61_003037 [Plenodomus lingam]
MSRPSIEASLCTAAQPQVEQEALRCVGGSAVRLAASKVANSSELRTASWGLVIPSPQAWFLLGYFLNSCKLSSTTYTFPGPLPPKDQRDTHARMNHMPHNLEKISEPRDEIP